ncbi:MAG: glycerophosphodiester phosphodiesterase [Planctomycetaceae bacterium]|jgi:glycerophosphoryl diester phosphodiesterase
MKPAIAGLAAGVLWLVGVTMAGADQPSVQESQRRPIVIAHRGASGQRPEHTLAAYQLAAEQGADFIEPDLVITRDGVLVARHEPEIGETTDVGEHPEFAARKTTKTLGGKPVEGWFVEDFTLAELKTLRARERLPRLRPESARFDNQLEIPTFPEILRLRDELTTRLGRVIGVYPETKHPARFASLGLPLEERVVADLRAHGLDSAQAPVFLQSFETESLRRLAKLCQLRRIQLLGSRPPFPLDDATASRDRLGWLTPRYLQEIRTFADGIGPDKNLLFPRTSEGRLGMATSLVADAHRAGLLVHPYTFRQENAFLPADFQRVTAGDGEPNPGGTGDLAGELRRFLELGIDGFFIDQPQVGVRVRDEPR